VARHPDLGQLAINTIRMLAVDAVRRAKSAGVVLGMHTFGMSAPIKVAHFGFTTDAVATFRQTIGRSPT
jgi:transketolase